MAEPFHYRVAWPPEDGEYVATARNFRACFVSPAMRMLPCAVSANWSLMSSLTCEAEPRARLKPASTMLLGGGIPAPPQHRPAKRNAPGRATPIRASPVAWRRAERSGGFSRLDAGRDRHNPRSPGTGQGA
jgi:hypothetical protein